MLAVNIVSEHLVLVSQHALTRNMIDSVASRRGHLSASTQLLHSNGASTFGFKDVVLMHGRVQQSLKQNCISGTVTETSISNTN